MQTNKECVIITGASSGIGLEATKILAATSPYHVVMACRNLKKSQPLCDQILKETGKNNVEVIELELGSYESIFKFVKEFKSRQYSLKVLVNNAAINATSFGLSKDGFEAVFATNHLGHFLLTHLLLDDLKAHAPSRVINVSSELHSNEDKSVGGLPKIRWTKEELNDPSNFSTMQAYRNSKLANVLFTLEAAKRWKGNN
jgi:light-dependent protochlorophyllide reductase